jgi:hypothetical protein
MTRGLRTTRDRLRHEILSGSHAAFEEARSRRPALAPYATAHAVLEALGCIDPATFGARDAVVRDLALEYRETHEALWSRMLLVAFYPAMANLRARLALGAVGHDEIDQVILTGFLNAVDTVSLRSLHAIAAFRICQLTERYVFRYLVRERGFRRVFTHTADDAATLARRPSEASCDASPEDAAELGLLLRAARAHGFPEATIALLQATANGRVSLSKFARHVEPTDDVARRRLYERLKQRRSRALKRLRALAG